MGGLLPGLCSISFRALDADAVLRLAADAGLACVEWGSDVHAPPGDGEALRALARRCGDAGLACPSYGSYWFAGRSEPAELEALFDAAEALGAGTLRIWTVFGAGPDERQPIEDAVGIAAARAAERGLAVGLEYHPGTLTETSASTRALLDAVGPSPNLFSYWQPEAGAAAERSLSELEAVCDRLAHVHVFSWDPTPAERRPLEHLEAMWRAALRAAARAPSGLATPRCAYLEYLPGDAPEALLRDAAVLARWIREDAA